MLSYQDSLLCLEGRPVQGLAEELATPFFLFSESRLGENYDALARGLSAADREARVRYCAKANHEPAVLALLASKGSKVLASHLGEVQLALESGFAAEDVSYQRPIALQDELRAVLEAGVFRVHLYRPEDLLLLEKLASERATKIEVSLRLRNDSPASRVSPLNFLSRRLGLGEAEALQAAKRIDDSPWLSLAALNIHRGTQLGSPESFRPAARRLARLAARVGRATGRLPGELNLGGGIPSPSLKRLRPSGLWRPPEEELGTTGDRGALEGFSRKLSELFDQEVSRLAPGPAPRLAVEPGRALVGDAALLVTRVAAVQGRWAFLDTSRNHLGESILLFSRRILPATRPEGRARKLYHLSGSTLNTMDVIGLRRKLPALDKGDVVALCDAGAYSLSRSTRYAGFSPAAYMLRGDGSLEMVRRGEDLSDLTSTAPGSSSGGRPPV